MEDSLFLLLFNLQVDLDVIIEDSPVIEFTSSGVPPLSFKKSDHQISQSFEPPLVTKPQTPYKQHEASPPS